MEKGRKKHKFLFFFILFILCIGTLVYTLPLIVSTKYGTKIASWGISNLTESSITIEELSLKWTEAPQVKNVTYIAPHNRYQIAIPKVVLQDPLWKILYSQKITTPLILDSISCVIPLTPPVEDVDSNQLEKKTHKWSWSEHIRDVVVKNGSLSLVSDENETIRVDHIYLEGVLDPKEIILNAKASTTFHNLEGTIRLNFTAPKNASIPTLELSTTNFPVPSIDELISIKYPKAKGLLTEIFGPILTADFNIKNGAQISTSLDILSANIKASMQGLTSGENFSLTKPAVFSCSVSPQLYKKCRELFFPSQQLSLTRVASLRIVLDALSIPYDGQTLNLSKLSYKAHALASPINGLTENNSQPFTLNSWNFTSASSCLEESLSLGMKSTLTYESKMPAPLAISCELSEPMQNLSSASLRNVHIESIKFPLSFLKALSSSIPGYLIDVLGEQLTLKLEPKGADYVCSVETPRLAIPKATIVFSESPHIADSTPFTYTLSQNQLNLLTNPYMKLSKMSKVTGIVNAFSLHPFLCNVDINTDSISFASSIPFGPCQLKYTDLHIEAHDLEKISFDLASTVTYEKESFYEQELWGNKLSLNIMGVANLQDTNNKTISYIGCKAESDRAKLDISAALDNNLTTLVFIKPVELNLNLSSEFLSLYMKNITPLVGYIPYDPLKIEIAIDPLNIHQPVNSQLSLSSTISLSKLGVLNKSLYKQFDLLDTIATIRANKSSGEYSCNLSSHIGDLGSISLQASSSSIASPTDFLNHLTTALQIKNLPSGFIDLFLGSKEVSSELFGDQLNLSCNSQPFDGYSLIEASVSSPLLQASSRFKASSEALIGEGSSLELSWKLTKESYSAIEEFFTVEEKGGAHPFILANSSVMNLSLKQFYWPFTKVKSKSKIGKLTLKECVFFIDNHLRNSSFDLVCNVDKMTLQSTSEDQSTTIKEFSIECIKNKMQSPLLLDVHTAAGEGSVKAHLRLQPTYGNNNQPILITKCEASLDNLPTLVIDSAFSLFGYTAFPPSIFVGNSLQGSFKADLENLYGTVDVELNSNEAKGSLNAYLTNGVLKLVNPIRAELAVTPKLADFFLKRMNVVLSFARDPLRLYIDNKGFYLPLDPFDVKQIQVRKAQANLGQIICTNRGNPEEIGGFFKLKIGLDQHISLWFAPMDFSINSGFLYIDRTELLFNQAYQIAFWGKIDLVKKYVDMTLGLTEQSLRKAFGVQGLPRMFVLQIPMNGPINNVRINKEVATARISLLLAKASGLTRQGGLWGNVVELLGDFANEQSSVPPPKPPFPWQEALSLYESEQKKQESLTIIK